MTNTNLGGSCSTSCFYLNWGCLILNSIHRNKHLWNCNKNSKFHSATVLEKAVLNVVNFVPLSMCERLSKTVIGRLTHWQNGCHIPEDHFKRFFLNEMIWISLKISLKCVPKVRINNIPALFKIMAWRRPGDKPLLEPVMFSLLTHICVTRPQWVNVVPPKRVAWHLTTPVARTSSWVTTFYTSFVRKI